MGREGFRHPDVVTADGEVVGSIGKVLWKDAKGFDVVTLDRPGADVVVPIKHDPAHGDVNILVEHVEYLKEQIETAPTAAEVLAAANFQEAVSLIAGHYDIQLSELPPGPGTGPLPPWWQPEPEPEPDKPDENPPDSVAAA